MAVRRRSQNLAGPHDGAHAGRRRRRPSPAARSPRQEAIKELGTNGGGFYNANSAHPFENPTPFTNLFEIFLLLLIPFALPRTFGRLVGDKRQGWAILAVMAVICPRVADRRLTALELHHSGHGPAGARAPRWRARRSASGCRSRRCSPPRRRTPRPAPSTRCTTRYTPLGGGIALINMMLGEVAPGGVGSGLYGILVHRRRDGVRRRADGRPHAGVPGQEDPRPRDEARRPLHPGHARGRAGRHGGRDAPPVGPGRDAQLRAARAVGGALRVHLRGEQQRLAPSPACRPTPPSTTSRSGWRCWPAGSCRCSSSSALAGSLARQAAGAGHRRAPCPPTRRCSSGCSPASSSSWSA